MVRAVPHDLSEQPPHHGRLVRSDEFRDQHVTGERLDCRIIDPGQHIVDALAGPLNHNVLVSLHRQPRAHTLRHLRGTDLGGNGFCAQEVHGHKRRHGLTQHVLLTRNDRGVRDGNPKRVPEQCGDGEPVGQASDHRRFRRPGHKPPHTGLVSEKVNGDKDDGGQDQEPCCDCTHAG